MCLLLNISMNNHDKMYCRRKFQGCLCICQNAEVVHAYMLKGYMLIFRNAEGVHGKRKVGNPCLKTY